MNADELIAASEVLIAEWQAGNAAGGEYDLDRLDHIIRDLALTIEAFLDNEFVEIGGQRMTQAQFDAARFPLLSGPPGELLEVIERRRHTGIIWAVPIETPIGVAVTMQRELAERYPSVIVAVAPGTAPLAFEWSEGEL